MDSSLAVSSLRRTEIKTSDTLGVVFEPAGGSDHFAVFLGGNSGGVPEPPAQRLADNGVSVFALAYHGAPGLPTGLVEIPIESVQRGIEVFRERFASHRGIGVMGISKGAELALVVAAHLGGAVDRVVAVAPPHVTWNGLKPFRPGVDRRSNKSSWSLHGVPLAFLQSPLEIKPVFNKLGLRTDAFYDLARHQPAEVDAARIPVERSAGPILLISGDDDHMWPSVPMAEEVVRRMVDHGRGDEVTSVVYPRAGHAFLLHDFMTPPGSGAGQALDFGGSAEADSIACEDAWRRSVAFLKASRVPAVGPR